MSIRYYFYKILHVTLLMGLLLILLAAGIWAAVVWYFIPQLPPVERLKDSHLQVPLYVYTKDKVFIAEYGEQRRIPLAIDKNKHELLINAVLAAEDDRFYEHQGVDLKGLLRAGVSLVKTGEKRQGGSTITMQLARNFFLSDIATEKTFTRKFKEILLAFKIEEELSKETILELYLNKIFLGHRAYGMGAAAQVYYGKDIEQLNLSQLAMLAGLPKAPSANNPVTNPKRALERRNYVLGRMLALKYITQEEHEQALKTPLTAQFHSLTPEIEASYVAEMVRSFLLQKFGEEITYTSGYKVFTTIDSHLQERANWALRNNLYRYDERHGFKGKIDRVVIPKGVDIEKWAFKILEKYPIQSTLIPSLVLETRKKTIVAYNQKAGRFKITWEGMSWARRYIRDNRRGRYPKNARSIVRRGDIIMARPDLQPPKNRKRKQDTIYKEQSLSEKKFKKVRWRLSQVPEIEGALVALNPKNGSIIALSGGYDFYLSKFNRVTQAQRQPGSTFKPFIYSAALARGFSHLTKIKDAPIMIRVTDMKWRPRNYTKQYYGWTTLRNALAHSYNVSAVRLLKKVGVNYTINHLTQFGFEAEKIPKNLTIALGTGELTPLELASGFAVFANGGFRIQPYFIDRIEDMNGEVIYSANPLKICRKCPSEILASKEEEESNMLVSHTACARVPRYAQRAIPTKNAYMITSMLGDVIRIGTGRRALKLKRRDIVGKTGTTNDLRDAWFAGYSPDIVTVVWTGFDNPRSLGYKETGGRTALPMWINFMGEALKGKREKLLPRRYLNLAQKGNEGRIYDKDEKRVASKKKRRVSKPKKSSSYKRTQERPPSTSVIPDDGLF
jgi:penicillin-binding protein 1A